MQRENTEKYREKIQKKMRKKSVVQYGKKC